MAQIKTGPFKKCAIDGCEKNAHWSAKGARGWCYSHWYKWRTYGAPTGGRQTATGEPQKFLELTIGSTHGQECLYWPFARNSAGYGHLVIDGEQKLAHRLICEATHGPAPSSTHYALHGCGNGHLGCCNPNHLRWGTASENVGDARRHGTLAIGEKTGQARLTNSQVEQIRRAKGVTTQTVLAERFGTTQSNISHIQRGKSWRLA